MTTIVADWRFGVMVSDSSISDGDRIWLGRKVFRIREELLGFCGDVDEVRQEATKLLMPPEPMPVLAEIDE